MGSLERVRARALVLALFAVIVGSVVYVFALKPEPGLYLELKLVRDGIDETSLLERSEVVWCVFAEAVAPPTLKEDAVKLVWSCFKGRGAVKVPLDALKPVAEGWDKVMRDRGVDPSTFTFGLIARVIVGNASSGEVLYTATDSVPLSPGMILQARAWKIELRLRKGRGVIQSEVREALATPKLARPVTAEAAGGAQPMQGGYYKFEVLYTVKPENLTTLPGDYFRDYNGKRYVRTPVLIAENRGSPKIISAVGVIADYTARFRITVGVGDILGKLINGVLPSLTLEVGGTIWGAKVSLVDGIDVCPNDAWWLYIWGRPSLVVGKVYYCAVTPGGTNCYWVHDRVEAYVSDVIVVSRAIDRGVEQGLPHSALTDAFFSGTRMRQLPAIPGTHLADGDLDPNEYISTVQLYPSVYSNAYIGIAVPTGALAAQALCTVLPPVARAACIAFTSAIASLFSYDTHVHVEAVIRNRGQYECGTNAPVIVFLRESIYQYNIDSKIVTPPVGFYFKTQNP